MKILIAAACALVVGIALGIVFCAATIRHLRRRVKELREIIKEGLPPEKPETMKRFVWACILNGFAWVWCSYILAALDKVQIAEELSKVALVEIIAPVAVYAGKSVLENLRACLKSPRACLGGVFSALTALKILAIRQDACGFLPCRAKNPLANPYTSRY